MSSSSFILKPKPAPIVTCDDVKNELKLIKSLCAKHEKLCRAFAKWKSDIEQNDAQLEILNETAVALRNRHKSLTDMLTHQPVNPELLSQLQREISAVETQVDIWIRELAEINDDRTRLDIEFIKLKSQLQQSMTNIELAQLDLESIEKRHRDLWLKFLHESEPQKPAPASLVLSVPKSIGKNGDSRSK